MKNFLFFIFISAFFIPAVQAQNITKDTTLANKYFHASKVYKVDFELDCIIYFNQLSQEI